jgi:hypothetical protein
MPVNAVAAAALLMLLAPGPTPLRIVSASVCSRRRAGGGPVAARWRAGGRRTRVLRLRRSTLSTPGEAELFDGTRHQPEMCQVGRSLGLLGGEGLPAADDPPSVAGGGQEPVEVHYAVRLSGASESCAAVSWA